MQNVFWPAAKLQLTAIVHRFANNNQDQLTNYYRLLSIDRLDFQ
jgi:hypothetical protein